jgi:chemotaxis methyl-accepting protein methylase/tetratricopeptide (TPR) repeat protein
VFAAVAPARADADEEPLGADERRVLPLLDARRDLRTLADDAGLSEFHAARALHQLVRRGRARRVVRPATAPRRAPTPPAPRSHRSLGIAFARAGMMESAARELRRVLELRPGDAHARLHLGLVALRARAGATPAAVLGEAAALPAPSGAVFHALGIARHRLGQLAAADEAFEEAARAASPATRGSPPPRGAQRSPAATPTAPAAPRRGAPRGRRARGGAAAWFHAARVARPSARRRDRCTSRASTRAGRVPEAVGRAARVAAALPAELGSRRRPTSPPGRPPPTRPRRTRSGCSATPTTARGGSPTRPTPTAPPCASTPRSAPRCGPGSARSRSARAPTRRRRTPGSARVTCSPTTGRRAPTSTRCAGPTAPAAPTCGPPDAAVTSAHHPTPAAPAAPPDEAPDDHDAEGFAALLAQVEREHGFRVGSYKQRCLRRRVAVRMRATGAHTYAEYAGALAADLREYERLLDALTINVTRAFRDWDAWEALDALALGPLVDAGGPVRAWSAGCASGEEAYSIAALLHARASRASEPAAALARVRVLGTDVDRACLAAAEAGVYAPRAFDDAPAALRARYFPPLAAPAAAPRAPGAPVARVAPELRELTAFARHDLLREPPPGGAWDLIACRNVVIYFDRESQEALFDRFHAALVPGGVLFLGRIETLLGRMRTLFVPLDARRRIFRRA